MRQIEFVASGNRMGKMVQHPTTTHCFRNNLVRRPPASCCPVVQLFHWFSACWSEYCVALNCCLLFPWFVRTALGQALLSKSQVSAAARQTFAIVGYFGSFARSAVNAQLLFWKGLTFQIIDTWQVSPSGAAFCMTLQPSNLACLLSKSCALP